jgi:hypothetical protein
MEGFGSARVGNTQMEAPNETRRRPWLLFPWARHGEIALRTLEKDGRHRLDLRTAPSVLLGHQHSGPGRAPPQSGLFRMAAASDSVAVSGWDSFISHKSCAARKAKERLFQARHREANACAISEVGHSRRFGLVRLRRHCGHKFLRQGCDGPIGDIGRLAWVG